jgi:uncharacterized phage protein (TIGR02218 family)
MKSLATQARAHFDLECTRLAFCWMIEKRDGAFIMGTEHDVDLEIDTGTYAGVYLAGSNITGSNIKASADASVDNMEVSGAVPDEPSSTIDVNVYDIESGNLSGAAVQSFICDWENPNAWQMPVQRGYLGEISRDSDGKYTTELRGLKQQLSQVFVRTYSPGCQVVRFGDSECGFNLASVTSTGTITTVVNRRSFVATIGVVGNYNGGELTFTSGPNNGVMREVKFDTVGSTFGNLSFWEPFPNEPLVGDTFTISQGCNRSGSRCIALGNMVNFRGYGIFIEGNDALARGPQ